MMTEQWIEVGGSSDVAKFIICDDDASFLSKCMRAIRAIAPKHYRVQLVRLHQEPNSIAIKWDVTLAHLIKNTGCLLESKYLF